MAQLQGKGAVVTGAGSGIGRAAALLFAEEGASVLAVDRDEAGVAETADRIRAAGGQGIAVAADAGSEADVTRFVTKAIEAFGAVDVLYANAGISGGPAPFLETTVEQWQEVLRVNLLGASSFARAVALALIEQGQGGRIVNLGSIAGLTGLPNIGPYNASKAALDALTRTLAVELGPYGILCNSVAPGTIGTEMVEGLMTANPALQERLVAKSPLGRIGTVGEASWPIVFLLTDAASFITGQTLVVDGGRLAAG